MAINLLETVQKNLGYPTLQKIDPNTEAVVENKKTADEDKFSQAAIPAVLTAFYRYIQSDAGAEEVLRGDNSTNWVDKIFHNNKNEVVHSIASYSNEKDEDNIPEKLNEIAYETIEVVKENLPSNANIKAVKLFFGEQRNTILLYLPAALNIGGLLNDDTLNDNTNKMEGPVSSLVQKLGAAFSKPTTLDEIKDQ